MLDDTIRRDVRNAAWSFFRVLAPAIVGMGTSAILARALGAASMGVYAYAIWVVGAIVLLFGLEYPLGHVIARLHGANDVSSASIVAQRGVRLALLLALTADAVLFILRRQIGAALSPNVLFVVLALILVQLPTSAAAGVVASRHRFRDLFFINFIGATAQIVLVVFGYFRRYDVAEMLTMLLVVSILRAIATFRRAHNALPPFELPRHSLTPEAASAFRSVTSVAIMGGMIDIVVWQQSEVWFLNRYVSTSDVAFYTIAFLIVARMANLLQSAALHLMPSWSEAWVRGQQDLIAMVVSHGIRYTECVTAGVVVFGFVAAPEVVHLIYGNSYRPVVPLLRILLLALPVTAIAGLPASLFTAAGRASWLIRIGIPAALANLVLDFGLIPRFGAVGAAIASATIQLLTTVVAFLLVRSFVHLRLPWKAVVTSYVASTIAVLPIILLPDTTPSAIKWCTGLLAYPALLVLFRVVNRDDLKRLRSALAPSSSASLSEGREVGYQL